jgi:protocatechuate 3,4-dioxygenase beta subunit
LLTVAAADPSFKQGSKHMKVQDHCRREFLQRVAGWGLAWAAGSYLAPSLAVGQNPPPPEPPDTKWTATIIPAAEPGEPLVVEGRVFAPDGQHTVAGVIVYAYNTDKDGYYSPDGKVGHPRLKGYMKTDAEGRFELHTIRPGRYPGMHIPAHVHFNLWGAGYPVQWTEELRFEGDSYLTEAMKSESEARGKFATIRPLSRDKNGIYHCEINLRLQEKSNYPEH